ncbi:MAG TPA: hypothetical protein VGT03_02210 [Candidatus Acidoferrales bacterium]|nr:hypothetical protein [Candidatus Acidoferrales bacterium]
MSRRFGGFTVSWGEAMREFAEQVNDKELIANSAVLIANETHSREESSNCKQTTYEFLIANEFRSSDSAFRRRATPKKLDSSLSLRNYSTSHFLIDNFCMFFRPVLPPASYLKPPAFRISNRPSPRLEMPVSHRKQTIAPISNRPQFALCNFLFRAPAASKQALAKAGNSPLSLLSLIANETHSRKESSSCKYGTYEILIANEFQSLFAAKSTLPSEESQFDDPLREKACADIIRNSAAESGRHAFWP